MPLRPGVKVQNDRTSDSRCACAGALADPAASVAYAAPELLLASEARQRLAATESADIWAVGVIMYECLSGGSATPLHERGRALAMARGLAAYPWRSPRQSATWEHSPPELRQVVLDCLSAAPQRRPSAETLVARVEDVIATSVPAQRSPTLRVESTASMVRASSFTQLASQVGHPDCESDGLEISQSPFSSMQSAA